MFRIPADGRELFYRAPDNRLERGGRRFLFCAPATQTAIPPTTVVVNRTSAVGRQ